MIPDPVPDEKLVEMGLRALSELLDSQTLDPRVLHDKDLAMSSVACNDVLSYLDALAMTNPNGQQLYHSTLEVNNESLDFAGEGQKNEEQENDDVPECYANGRPMVSYVDMIKKALLTSPSGRMKLNEMYAWIQEHYPFYRTSKLSWKVNKVRLDYYLSWLIELCKTRVVSLI